VEIGSLSSRSSPPAPPAIRRQGPPAQLISRNHKHTLGLRIRNIDYPQVSSGPGLTEGDSGTLSTGTVFTRSAEDILYFLLANSMVIDMGFSCLRIKIEANIHMLHPSDSDEISKAELLIRPGQVPHLWWHRGSTL
jgi:hypothetical protein